MLKETIDTNSSNENYADRFALPIAEAEEKTEMTNQQQIGNIQQAINLISMHNKPHIIYLNR